MYTAQYTHRLCDKTEGARASCTLYSKHTDCKTKQKKLEHAVHCIVYTQTVRQNSWSYRMLYTVQYTHRL